MMSMLKNSDFTEDLGKLIRDQKRQDSSDQEKELGIFRSGSAPPSVDGLVSSVYNNNGGKGELLSEEELMADADYADFYFMNSNINTRLPPPLLSKEDWRFPRRLQGGNKNTNMSIFSSQPESGGQEGDNNGVKEWRREGLIGLRRQNIISEIIQDNMNHVSTTITGNFSCAASRNAFHDDTKTQFANLHHDLASVDALCIGSTSKQGMHSFQNVDSPVYHTSVSAFSSPMSRSITPDPQLVAQIRSHHNLPIGGGWPSCVDKRNTASNTSNGVTTGLSESADLLASFSGLDLSTNANEDNNFRLRTQHGIGCHDFTRLSCDQNACLTELESDPFLHSFAQSAKGLNMSRGNGVEMGLKSSFVANGRAEFCKSANCQKGPFRPTPNGVGSPCNLSANKLNSPVSNFGLNGFEMNPSSLPMMGSLLENCTLPPLFQGIAPTSTLVGSCMDTEGLARGLRTNLVASASELHALNELGNHGTMNPPHASFLDPLYLNYLRSNEVASAKFAALNNSRSDKDYGCNSYVDFLGLQRAYLEALLAHKKSQYSAPYLGKLNCMNRDYCRNDALDLDISYRRSPLASPVFPNSPVGSGSPMRHSDWDMPFSSSLRNRYSVAKGAWHSDTGCNMEERFESSLLDEFKSNKTKCFELSEIAGHVVEFSADQYGSRFIQQKLEIATIEEKNMVFNEIMPHSLALMTDVFGNYVIQKFLEHGSGPQIRELADKLTGHVLALSLQMYGCRVIQKAIEVAELNQKTSMVKELDGHVMRCVRDQNGNHVIQKCIECVPEDAIQFIVSAFYDQVVILSTHPYGCRVIQRILEHCHDPKTQQIVMDEILQSVHMLAQDQYGNYVVQHVLERGKPEERSVIIKKFTGQIVQMSQQKFASNVIEKCLIYGTPTECQTLVDEMLGSTDENDPLQVMMKDQFANYVVQKVLETCDDQQLELILNRIKVHLNALKKYTYGKHIVARVEKLVAAGERRINSILTAS